MNFTREYICNYCFSHKHKHLLGRSWVQLSLGVAFNEGGKHIGMVILWGSVSRLSKAPFVYIHILGKRFHS